MTSRTARAARSRSDPIRWGEDLSARPNGRRLRGAVALLAALTASAAFAGPAERRPARPERRAAAPVDRDRGDGPGPGRDRPGGEHVAGRRSRARLPVPGLDVDLAKAGYVEQEYLIAGQATRYAITGTNTATVQSTGHPYATRIVVRRPRRRREVQRHRDRRVDQRQQSVGPGGRLVPVARALPAGGLRLGRRLRPARRPALGHRPEAVEPVALRRARRHRRRTRSPTTRCPTTSSPRRSRPSAAPRASTRSGRWPRRST